MPEPTTALAWALAAYLIASALYVACLLANTAAKRCIDGHVVRALEVRR